MLVRVVNGGTALELVWCSCISYCNPKTTNNVAEYWGLVHGLRYAQLQRLRRVTVP